MHIFLLLSKSEIAFYSHPTPTILLPSKVSDTFLITTKALSVNSCCTVEWIFPITTPKSNTMPSYEHFSGQLSAISQTASPGLQFLKEYLPLLDSDSAVFLDKHVKPSASLISNGSEPMRLKEISQMFEKRTEMLSLFTHTAHPIEAWDMEKEKGERTVIFHSVSK